MKEEEPYSRTEAYSLTIKKAAKNYIKKNFTEIKAPYLNNISGNSGINRSGNDREP